MKILENSQNFRNFPKFSKFWPKFFKKYENFEILAKFFRIKVEMFFFVFFSLVYGRGVET